MKIVERETPLAARSGQSNPRGKLTERIEVQVDEETRRALDSLAFHNGRQTISEYVRGVLNETLWGRVDARDNKRIPRDDGESTLRIAGNCGDRDER